MVFRMLHGTHRIQIGEQMVSVGTELIARRPGHFNGRGHGFSMAGIWLQAEGLRWKLGGTAAAIGAWPITLAALKAFDADPFGGLLG